MHAKGDLIAFIDADTVITKGWMQKAVNEFAVHKNLVALSGPVSYDLNVWYSSLIDAYFDILVLPLSKITGSLVLCGNLVVRKNAIIDIGGFDTKIAFYGDDTNIARRLQKVGKVVFKRNFFIYTSGRRLKKEGITKNRFYLCGELFFRKIFPQTNHKKISRYSLKNDTI